MSTLEETACTCRRPTEDTVLVSVDTVLSEENLHEAVELLRRAFGVQFNVVDGQTGQAVVLSPEQPARDWLVRGELCREVARRGRAELIDEDDPLVVLAVPLPADENARYVAVASFLSRPVIPGENLQAFQRVLGLDVFRAAVWIAQQAIWPPQRLMDMASLVAEQLRTRQRLDRLEGEARSLSANLASTYEEISLLHRLTQHLKISESDEDLARRALEWMQAVLPAEGLAVQLAPVAETAKSLGHSARAEPVLLSCGRCPVDNAQFMRLVEYLGPVAFNRPIVVNGTLTRAASWPCPQVRQMIAAPLAEGTNLFGWLAAFNHSQGAEFGTVEASLVNSVSVILGIHRGNIELYRQQSELLTGIVRALTSAIDAKDPYTCGHSDRVARIAVRLAQELGCDAKAINTIYLSGLLHDIGKIGVDDSVLRKPSKLTDAEYEQIKTHVEVGHRILIDLKKLDDVLPVVLHHHESWDGQGYPHRLPAEKIPLAARIVAVADAFDAMGSDRPYRKGLADEQIDEIFRKGAGKQWDPEVVAAFFRARNDIRDVVRSKHQRGPIDVPTLAIGRPVAQAVS